MVLHSSKRVFGMEIRSVGIVGAGQMGNGIAHVFALAGYEVLLNDVNPEMLGAAIATIDKNMEQFRL